MSTIRASCLGVLMISACSGGNNSPDANVIVADARIDTPPPPPGCDYGELQDTTNDDISSVLGMAETTSVAFTSEIVLCGKIHASHYDGAQMLVDADSYAVIVPVDTSMRVTLTSAGAEALDDVELYIEGADTYDFGVFLSNHATTNADLPAGNYKVTVFAAHAAAIAADLDYKVKLVADDLSLRCTRSIDLAASPTGFTEINDGTGSDNDMVAINFEASPERALTGNSMDVPEPSAIIATSGMKYRITGTSADVNPADEYHDRDTYLFTTGPTTNQLSVRLNWASTATDFDMFVFPAGEISEISTGSIASNTEDEFATFAVKPDTQYWLWVGAYDDGLVYDTSYDATICADTFTP